MKAVIGDLVDQVEEAEDDNNDDQEETENSERRLHEEPQPLGLDLARLHGVGLCV